MKPTLTLFILLLFTLTVAPQSAGQQKLKVFLEGSIPDFNYVRNNIKFVDFVNEPPNSDIHVIVSRQLTGGDGRVYTLNFNCIKLEDAGELTLSCNTFSFNTEEEIRKAFTSTLKSGLIPYVNQKTGPGSFLITDITPEPDDEVGGDILAVPGLDPWKNWTFSIGVDGGLSGEEQKNGFEYSVSFRAKKVTEKWKIISEYDYDRRETTIRNEDNGTEYNTLRLSQDADIGAVFSITDHWSWGLFFQGTQNTYYNNKSSFQLNPAIEYNFFKWDESDRRRFTIRYNIGPSINEYYERTVFRKDNEVLWGQSIEINTERVEEWGDIDATISGGHFFPGFENYFFQAEMDFSIRISRGLSITFEFAAESIHNQRYLPESELSEEELLLNTRKLPTTFEYSGQIGFRFRFGSMYNNIVNERLD